MSTALSLVCGQCGVQLKSVKEAQEHGDLTGHSQFEESTEPVLNMTCTECRKPCRSQTEQDLHTKRTGHTTFVDNTDKAMAMDTEEEMQQAKADLREDQAPGGSSGAAGAGIGEKAVELVEPAVNAELMVQLQDMGFSYNRAVRALHATGTENMEQAVNWIVEHMEDADADMPLLLPKEEQKVKMNPEEARKAAEDLIRKIKQKREKEEIELEKLREKERIRSGKELGQAKKMEEGLQLKRNLESRRIEKEEERRARDKIKVKLDEDKRERRRKLGLPEEPTAEELAAKAALDDAAAAKKDAQRLKDILPVKPVSMLEKMRAKLVEMKKASAEDDAKLKTAWNTMLKLIGNVAQNPGVVKYQSIKLGNPAFQSKVASVPHSLEFLEIVGFKRDGSGEMLEITTDVLQITLNAAGAELNNAITNPFFGML